MIGAVRAASLPAGSWYAEQQGRMETVYSVSHYNSDGSFSNSFRECWLGGSRDHIESGEWSMSGDRMHEVTEIVSGRGVHLVADYEVTRGIDDTWTIRVVGGEALRILGHMARRLVRVAPNFVLPTCAPIS
jgi:hypothetical protein